MFQTSFRTTTGRLYMKKRLTTKLDFIVENSFVTTFKEYYFPTKIYKKLL